MRDHFLGRCFTAGVMPFAVLIVIGSLVSLALWALGRWLLAKAFKPQLPLI